MATYKQIQDWIRNTYGFTAQTCHIADVKRKCGLPVRLAHNRIDPNNPVKPCPPEKVEPIRKALRHFNMI